MYELKLKPFVEVQDALVSWHTVLEIHKAEGDVPLKACESVSEQINQLIEQLSQPEFAMSRAACESLLHTLRNTTRRPQIMGDVHFLRRTLLNQAGLISAIMLSPAERDLAEPKSPLFGVEVESKAPQMSEDIAEAGKCVAFGRYTASVFHLMRVMEIGLQRLGELLGVQLVTEKNWQNILDEVTKAVKALNQKEARTKTLAEAASHLYAVKVAWRNEVMHPKQTYTQEQAEAIFENVRTFVRDLAGLL